MDTSPPSDMQNLQENFEDFFEHSLCGFITADPQGIIIRANSKLAAWMGIAPGELTGKRFSDLLSVGSKIYYATHLSPLLRMQGFYEEIVLELSCNTGQKLRVMVNAFERKSADGKTGFVRYTIFKANDRLQYERNLQLEKMTAENEAAKQTELVALREQLIAVLGHDLRNPLASIRMAIGMLQASQGTSSPDLLAVLKRSSLRMTELVNNIMDFARTRLGGGIILAQQPADLGSVIQQVIAELQLAHPERIILSEANLQEPIYCDPDRVAQLLSNLVANAITHGDSNAPVIIRATTRDSFLELSVCNQGKPIPPEFRDQLFIPFTRETSHPSQHGLGLGLYISSQIAQAHGATLNFTSVPEETCFTFKMPLTSLL